MRCGSYGYAIAQPNTDTGTHCYSGIHSNSRTYRNANAVNYAYSSSHCHPLTATHRDTHAHGHADSNSYSHTDTHPYTDTYSDTDAHTRNADRGGGSY